jgi:HK97 family phage portal protein
MKKKSRSARQPAAFKSFTYDPADPNHWSSAEGFNWLRLGGQEVNATRVNAFANSIVAACLAWGTRNFRQAFITLLRETEPKKYEQISSHPALDLLKRPNDHYTAKTLWIGLYLSYQLDGNAYLIKVKNARGFGRPVELYYAPHWCMRPVYTPGSSVWIDYYEYTFEGKVVRFAPEDVIHLKNGVDPGNPRLGYAPLKAALLEVFTDEEAARFTAALLKNMGVPGIIISSGDPATLIEEGEAKGLIEKFKRRFTGKKRGEPFVATGALKVDTIGFTPDEMSLDGLRKLPADRVLGVLGIPGAVVGLGSGVEASTYNNLRNYQRQAFEQHLVPVWDDFAEELTDQYLRDFDDDPALFFDFDTSEVAALREDEDATHKRARENFTAGIWTHNQALTVTGQQPVAGGDYYILPVGVQIVSAQVAAAAAAVPMSERGGALFAAGDTPAQLASKALAAIAAASAKRLPAATLPRTPVPGAYKSLDDGVEQTKTDAEEQFAEALRAAFVEMATDVPAEVEAVGDLSDPARAAEAIGARVVGRRVELFTSAFDAMHQRIEEEVAAHVRRALSSDAVSNEAARAAIAGNNAARVAAYTSDLKQQTVTAVREAILSMAEGATREETVQRIAQNVSGRQMYPGVFDNARSLALTNGSTEAEADAAGEQAASLHRAQLIAETEARVAANYDLIESMGTAGVKSVLVHDGADCGWEYHDDKNKADGTIKTLSEARRYPLSHPRCQRRFTPVTK